MKKILLFLFLVVGRGALAQNDLSLKQSRQYIASAKQLLGKVLENDKTAIVGTAGFVEDGAYVSATIKNTEYWITFVYGFSKKDTVVAEFTIEQTTNLGDGRGVAREYARLTDGVLQYTVIGNGIDPNAAVELPLEKSLQRFDKLLADVRKRVFLL